MAVTEQVKVPDIGGFDAVDVVEVLVGVGDTVAVEDPLITLESDKASMEVPSTVAGEVVEVHVGAGDKVSEGDPIVTIEVEEGRGARDEERRTRGEGRGARSEERGARSEEREPRKEEGEGGAEEPEPKRPDSVPAEEEPAAAPAHEGPSPAASSPARPERGSAQAEERPPSSKLQASSPTHLPHASPAIRRFARELGVDLGLVSGSGRNGRITREDVQGFVKGRLAGGAGAEGSALPEMPVIDFAKFGEIEKVELSRIQKLTGANVHRSWLHVPHVTQHDEADITELEAFRKAHAEEAKTRGFKLTPVAFILKACVAALQEYPRVNSSLDADGEHVVLKRYYHVGVAVDTDEGLVVPVIRNVDEKGVYELAEELAETSQMARDGRLKLEQLQGASFTVSSLGGIGGTAFTPIVNAPEVAILGVSRARFKPHWTGSEFEPRLMLPLSLSYDHRVIDGALAVRFTTYLAAVLSDIRRLLL